MNWKRSLKKEQGSLGIDTRNLRWFETKVLWLEDAAMYGKSKRQRSRRETMTGDIRRKGVDQLMCTTNNDIVCTASAIDNDKAWLIYQILILIIQSKLSNTLLYSVWLNRYFNWGRIEARAELGTWSYVSVRPYKSIVKFSMLSALPSSFLKHVSKPHLCSSPQLETHPSSTSLPWLSRWTPRFYQALHSGFQKCNYFR